MIVQQSGRTKPIRTAVRCGLGVVAVVLLVAGIVHLERRRPTLALERAGATLICERNGDVRSISFASSRANDSHLRLIAEFPTLRTVNIAHSRVTRDGLEALQQLPQLASLDLSDTKSIQGGLEVVARFPALRALQLRRCSWLNDDELAPVVRLQPLESLLLVDADITDASLRRLVSLPKLKQLSLENCDRITNAGLKELARHPGLEELSIDRCDQLTDEGVMQLASMPSLQSLSVCGIPMRPALLQQFVAQRSGAALHVDDYEVPVLQPLIDLGARFGYDNTFHLRWLEIDNRWHDPEMVSPFMQSGMPDTMGDLVHLRGQPQEIDDSSLEALSLVPELQQLYLREIPITDAALQHVCRLRELRVLELENVQITDGGLQQLAVLKNLETLWLKRVRLTGEGLASLRDLPQLTELILLSDRLTPEGMQQLESLKTIETLAIGDVTRVPMIDSLEHLPNLRELGIVRATLSAEDMQQIRETTHVELLHLWHVRLQEGALVAMSDMTDLRSLLLARCQFNRQELDYLQKRRNDLLVSGFSELRHGPAVFGMPQRQLLQGISHFFPDPVSTLH